MTSNNIKIKEKVMTVSSYDAMNSIQLVIKRLIDFTAALIGLVVKDKRMVPLYSHKSASGMEGSLSPYINSEHLAHKNKSLNSSHYAMRRTQQRQKGSCASIILTSYHNFGT